MTDDLKAQGDGAEPVAWQYRYRPVGTEAWSDWSDGKAPEMRGGSYETEDRPLYAHPPAPVEVKPWYEVDAHRDLSRIIPDMEGKIAEAKVRYAHCLPEHLFMPLEASISELKVLRHEVIAPPASEEGDQ